jgi:hypothetical protein
MDTGFRRHDGVDGTFSNYDTVSFAGMTKLLVLYSFAKLTQYPKDCHGTVCRAMTC